MNHIFVSLLMSMIFKFFCCTRSGDKEFASTRHEMIDELIPLNNTMSAAADDFDERGFEFVGMSSVRPLIAVMTEKSESDMAKIIQSLNWGIAIRTRMDNQGLTITIESREILCYIF